MKKKWILIIIIFIVIIVAIYLFFEKSNYKNLNFGNTISKETSEIVKNILNMNSFEAEIELTVTSNKNENSYKISQKYKSPNQAVQVINEPENIKGLTISYDGNNLKLENTKLGLKTVYENYPYVSDNKIWLTTFIQEYKQNSSAKYEENGSKIMMMLENEEKIKQTLTIDKNTRITSFTKYREY